MQCVCDGAALVPAGKYQFKSTYFRRQVYTDRRIYRCSGCGLRQANMGAVDSAHLTAYYTGYYRAVAGLGLGLGVSEFYIARGRALANLISAESPRRIFELGAGHGYNLVAMRERFPSAATFTDEVDSSVKPIDGVSKGALSDGEYDVIILSHVLEHFTDPLEVLRGVTSALTPNGVAIIEVPNDVEGIIPLNGPDEPHLTFFTQDSLLALLKKAGLRIDALFAAGPDFRRLTASSRAKAALRAFLLRVPVVRRHVTQRSARKMREFSMQNDFERRNPSGLYLRAVVRRPSCSGESSSNPVARADSAD